MKKTVGVLTALAMLSAGSAFAGGDKVHSQPGQQQQQGASGTESSTTYGGSGDVGTSGSPESMGTSPATGGSGTTGSGATTMGGSGSAGAASQGQTMGAQQLTGTVVKADRKMIYLDHMGAIVPLKINNQTQFTGNVTRAQDLKEGQQVRASYSIEGKTDNVAKSIELSSGTNTMQGGQGGSGLEGSPINDIPAGADPMGSEPIDPTLDTDLSNPATTPSTGESRGPASPLPGEGPAEP